METLALNRNAAMEDMMAVEPALQGPALNVPEFGLETVSMNTLDPVAVEVTKLTGLEEQQELGRIERYAQGLRSMGNKALAGIAGLSTFGAGFGGAAAFANERSEKPAMIRTIKAEDMQAAEKSTPRTTWTRLGGDPLIQGGITTRAKLQKVNGTKTFVRAQKYAGLNATERKAVDMEIRTGDFKECKMMYGETFKAMSFGRSGTSVDKNVTFLDPRFKNKAAKAWCIDAEVTPKGSKTPTEKVIIKIPFICGNFAVKKIVEIDNPKNPKNPQTPKNPKPPVKPPVTPEGDCYGDTTNTNSGDNNGNGGTNQAGNCSPQVICSPVNSPNAVVCSPTTTTVETTTTPTTTTPPTTTTETVTTPPPTTTTPPPVKYTPSVELTGPQHVLVDGRVQICGYQNDIDNNIVSTTFSETGNGNIVSQVYNGDEAGERCIMYQAGTQPENVSVTMKVVDADNNTASDTENFPIEARPGGF